MPAESEPFTLFDVDHLLGLGNSTADEGAIPVDVCSNHPMHLRHCVLISLCTATPCSYLLKHLLHTSPCAPASPCPARASFYPATARPVLTLPMALPGVDARSDLGAGRRGPDHQYWPRARAVATDHHCDPSRARPGAERPQFYRVVVGHTGTGRSKTNYVTAKQCAFIRQYTTKPIGITIP